MADVNDAANEEQVNQPESGNEISKNLQSEREWLRVLFMVLFAFCGWVSSSLIGLVAFLQLLFALVTARENDNLRRLGSSLAQYVAELANYLTYNTDQKPFPFAEWPAAKPSRRDLGEESSHQPGLHQRLK